MWIFLLNNIGFGSLSCVVVVETKKPNDGTKRNGQKRNHLKEVFAKENESTCESYCPFNVQIRMLDANAQFTQNVEIHKYGKVS